MIAKIETVTPSLAKKLLGANSRNRKIRKDHWQKISQEIKNGLWRHNGDSIKIDRNGNILDGQHRLLGIADSGIDCKAVMVSELEPEMINHIDVDRCIRRTSDILTIHGYKNTTQLAGAATTLHAYYDRPLSKINVQSPYKVLEFIKQNSFIMTSASFCEIKQSPRMMGGATLSAIHFIASKNGLRAEVESFIEQFSSGVGLEKGSAVLSLRNRIIDENQKLHSNGSFLSRYTRFGRLIDTFNRTIQGRKRASNYLFEAGKKLPRVAGDHDDESLFDEL